MHVGAMFHHAEFCRAKVGEGLVIAFDDDKNVILYPSGGSPNLCTVYLEEEDEFSLDNIPSYLINQYQLDGLDMAKCVDGGRICFIDHSDCKKASLHEFAGWYPPVILTATRLVGADHKHAQSELDLVSN